MKKVIAAGVVGILSIVPIVLFSPSVEAQVIDSVVCSTSGWDHSDSNPFNTPVETSQYTDAGLVLDLTGPRAGGKQSGYVDIVDVNLSTVNQTDALLTYIAESGPAPAFQLRAHAAGGDVWNGHLVYEGGKWWATRPQDWPLVPTASMASGGASLSEYKTAYPLASVSHIGFSLGSGVMGKGLLVNLTFQGTMWLFKGTCPTPPTTTTTTSTTTTAPTTTTTESSETSSSSSGSSSPTTTTASTTSVSSGTSSSSSSLVAIVDVGSSTPNDLAYTGTSNTLKLLGLAGCLIALGVLSFIGLRIKRSRPQHAK